MLQVTMLFLRKNAELYSFLLFHTFHISNSSPRCVRILCSNIFFFFQTKNVFLFKCVWLKIYLELVFTSVKFPHPHHKILMSNCAVWPFKKVFQQSTYLVAFNGPFWDMVWSFGIKYSDHIRVTNGSASWIPWWNTGGGHLSHWGLGPWTSGPCKSLCYHWKIITSTLLGSYFNFLNLVFAIITLILCRNLDILYVA